MIESDLIPYVSTPVINARRVLVLAPHPDDEVFGCGGSLAAHVAAGAMLKVIVLTDGQQHGHACVRASESREAAKILGYGVPEFWGEKDRELLATTQLAHRLADSIRLFQADLIYAPSVWEFHPDHRQTAWLALQAVQCVAGHCRLAFYEVGAPLRPNVLVDITAWLETKQKAMACFASQLAHQDYGLKISALNRFRTYTLPDEVKAAEAFLLLHAHELPTFIRCLDVVSWGSAPSSVARTLSPLVSVVLRSSGGEFLYRALDDIALQTWNEIEIEVICTATNPPPSLVNAGWRHPVRFVAAEPNSSWVNVAMVGLQRARGKFVFFMDDSESLLPDHIAGLMTTLLGQPHSLGCNGKAAMLKFADLESEAWRLSGLLFKNEPPFKEHLLAWLRNASAQVEDLGAPSEAMCRSSGRNMAAELQGPSQEMLLLSKQLHEARQQVNALLTSRSWRLTRPLRAVLRLYQRIVGTDSH